MMKSLAGLLVLASAVSHAEAPRDQGQSSKDEKICRTEDTTGSRLAKRRVCRTAEEWKEIAEEARRANNEAAQRGMTGASKYGT